MKERTLIAAGALNMFVAVGCGAFGAHGLKKMISEEMLAIWHTAVTYQVMHALGMIAIVLLMPRMAGAALHWAGRLMLAGIVFALLTVRPRLAARLGRRDASLGALSLG